MKVWVFGDADGQFSEHLGRRLRIQIAAGLPSGPGRHVVIAISLPVPDEILENADVELLVLIEPGIDERDRVTRMLAALERRQLAIVEHVAAEIQAERTWALLLALLTGVQPAVDALRSMPLERSDLVQGPPAGGSWLKLPSLRSVNGLTLGFLGFGPMAWRMSIWARDMGMRVIGAPLDVDATRRVETEGAALKSDASLMPYDRVLSAADVVVLDVEYSDATLRLIDSPELALMPPGALLVNTSHGRAIDEGALLQVLRDGRLAGVALDRFNYEPLPADSELRKSDRILLTPGIAAPDRNVILERMAQQSAQAIAELDAGIVPRKVRYFRRRPVSSRGE